MKLVPFTAELLPAVRPWFHHPAVDEWLGGPDWPAQALTPQPMGEVFRGKRALRAHTWVAVAGGETVALIGGEVYDRWCRYDETPDGPVIDRVEPGPAMGFAYVVDPARWRQGIGTATLRAMFAAPEVADVRVFAAGIEPANVASVRCVAAAGMVPSSDTPDWEGMVHHLLRRDYRCSGAGSL